MKIINPNNHPAIKQIKACKSLRSQIKSEACKEIAKMIMDEAYRVSNEGRYGVSRDSFMEIADVAELFSWGANRLGHNFWLIIAKKLKTTKHQGL